MNNGGHENLVLARKYLIIKKANLCCSKRIKQDARDLYSQRSSSNQASNKCNNFKSENKVCSVHILFFNFHQLQTDPLCS